MARSRQAKRRSRGSSRPKGLAGEVAGRLKRLRAAVRMTQAELAVAAGVTDETVSRAERGAFEPSLSTLVAVATVLQAPLDALVHAPAEPHRPVRQRVAPLLVRLAELAARLETRQLRALVELATLLTAAVGPERSSPKARGRDPRSRA